MATILLEGFENYANGVLGSTTNKSNFWTPFNGGANVSSSSPRNGSKHIITDAAEGGDRIFSSGLSTSVGFHIALAGTGPSASLVTAASGGPFVGGSRALRFGLSAALPSNGVSSLGLLHAGNNSWSLYRNNTLLGTTGAFPLSTYVSHDVTFNGSTGEWSWQVNGVQFANGTTTVETTGFDRITLGQDGSESILADDIYVRDTPVHVGDILVEYIVPNADTSDADFTLSTGSDGFDLIDDIGSNAATVDTTFLQADNINDTSTFDLANLVNQAGAIFAVGVFTRAQKTTGGTTVTRSNLVSGGSTGNGSSQVLSQTFSPYEDYFDTDPNGGGAWSSAAVNALQVQLERTS